MSLPLSPSKLILLAARLASNADIDTLSFLVSRHTEVLRKDVVLRILLTFLGERTPSHTYVPFLQELLTGEFPDYDPVDIEAADIHDLDDEQASNKVRGLRLLPLKWPAEIPAVVDADGDAFGVFLLLRAHRVDQECGLTQLPDLLVPFLHSVPAIRPWMVSVLLPLLRRNFEYHPQHASPHTLAEFQSLADSAAVSFLLSHTGSEADGLHLVGRDLRGMIGPWMLREARLHSGGTNGADEHSRMRHVQAWITQQAQKNWPLAVEAFVQWDGPTDADLGDYGNAWWSDEEQRALQSEYIRAGLAAAYSVADSSLAASTGTLRLSNKVAALLDNPSDVESLEALLTALREVPNVGKLGLSGSGAATSLRRHLLEDNPLTNPRLEACHLLWALICSAAILTGAGIPCTARRAGDIAFLHSMKEQKTEAVKFIHGIANRAPKNDDQYWIKARKQLLWLHSRGLDIASNESKPGRGGILGLVDKQFLETEFLKSLLSCTRYSVARAIYEDGLDQPLHKSKLQDTVVEAALFAFDSSSNPNRTRGGLKKCDDIIHSFPSTVGSALPAVQRITALLKATHSLSEYRLVLKQGEPFSPVVLRVHSDPISIIGRVLEQNAKSYTKLPEFVEVAVNMVLAGLYEPRRPAVAADKSTEMQSRRVVLVQRRVLAMCIEAALAEDDFETAYSYVVSRLAAADNTAMAATLSSGLGNADIDSWSWRAALKAGQYIRTTKTTRPTHLGTASGNPSIRHLEQRIECLATALRVAPATQLQEILKTFRRCEEQLDSAIKEEAAREEAWDMAGDLHSPSLPGAFSAVPGAHADSLRGMAHAGAARQAAGKSRQTEEGPVSLFGLGRATAEAAKRNLGVLSSSKEAAGSQEEGDQDETRARKRDQLRDAAMGTLVSGVGWLVGAPAPQRD